MKYSIVIPHFNSLLTLKKLYASIPVHDSIEVIIVDDNSDIQIKNELATFFSEKKAKILFNDSGNKGAGACRNIGIREAKGKWLIFADSDDLFCEGWFSYVEKYYGSKSDIVFFRPNSFSDDPSLGSSRHVIFNELIQNYLEDYSELSELRLKYFFVVPWSKMIKRNLIIDNSILFSEILLSNDILFAAKIASFSNSIECSNNTIYNVRLSSGSMTTKISKERYSIRLEAWIDYVNYIASTLSFKEFKMLNISGLPKLFEVFRYRLGIEVFFKTLATLRKNNISIVDKRVFNPIFLINRLGIYRNKWKQEKRYEVKK